MDEWNCTKEYRGIERNVGRDNTHVEMVVQEGVVPKNLITNSMRFENILACIAMYLCFSTMQPSRFVLCCLLSKLISFFFPTPLIFIVLFSSVFLILLINYSKPSQFSCSFKFLQI